MSEYLVLKDFDRSAFSLLSSETFYWTTFVGICISTINQISLDFLKMELRQ